jgi:enoyl-CoA hydratase
LTGSRVNNERKRVGTSDIVGAAGPGLRFEVTEAGVGVLTFDRPEQLNAVDWPLYRRLGDALDRIATSPAVRVLVVQGAGRAFCAGGDVSFMRQMHDGDIDKEDVARMGARVFGALTSLPQPSIAVVQGPAIGLGCTIALCCDLVFAGEEAVFADPHVQMGLVPGDGGTVLWPLLIGPARAKEYLLTGDPIRAAEADRLGLVNHVYATDELRDRALAFAGRLANGPGRTLQAAKALINHQIRTLGEETIRGSLAMETVSQASAYHRDAVKRFLDGDPVRF